MSKKTTKKVFKKNKKVVKKIPKKMGRPRVFDGRLEELGALMRLKPTLEDTAAFFQCGKTTVEDTIKAEFLITFREFREQNMVHTRLDLVRKAIRKADKSDTMHIFCLKNLCGWKDKQESERDIVAVTVNVEQTDLEDRIKQLEGDSD